MDATARRQFLKAGTSLAVLGALPRAVQAAMGPNDKFDLLVRNANVLDPSQSLTGKRDIGIRYGLIEIDRADHRRRARRARAWTPAASW